MSEPTVITLKFPFEFGDRLVESVSLERLKGKDLKKLPASPTMADLMNLASKSSKEAPALLDEMDAEDLGVVLEVVGGFLGSSPKTGST